MVFVAIKIEWDGRLARLFSSKDDGRDARPTLFHRCGESQAISGAATRVR